jgi:hypothetical protein
MTVSLLLRCLGCGLTSWKSTLGNESCIPCPANSTTSYYNYAIGINQCYCLEGHEAAIVGIACTPCAPDFIQQASYRPSPNLCEACRVDQTTSGVPASTECTYRAGWDWRYPDETDDQCPWIGPDSEMCPCKANWYKETPDPDIYCQGV